MSGTFNSDAQALLQETGRDIKAWTGAMQFVVYSMPRRTGVLQVAGDEGQARNHVSLSPDGWFENASGALTGAVKSAEGALACEWEKRRDPRHDTPEAKEEFIHRYEEKVAAIAQAVFAAEDAIREGVIPPNRQVNAAMDKVKADLRKMVALYDDHCYEMTISGRDNDLLALRARIIDGQSKAI